METGFDFGVGVFSALFAYKFGFVVLIIVLFLIFYIHTTYKNKTRVCPKCKAKGKFEYYSIGDIIKCRCRQCNNEWCL